MPYINKYSPISGRQIKEDNTVINIAEMIEAIYKAYVIGNVTINHSALAVTTASQTALAANANRKYASFQNDSDTVIYLKVGSGAVVGQGYRINPNGGSLEMSPAIGNLSLSAIYAVHNGTGNKNLLISEGV